MLATVLGKKVLALAAAANTAQLGVWPKPNKTLHLQRRERLQRPPALTRALLTCCPAAQEGWEVGKGMHSSRIQGGADRD